MSIFLGVSASRRLLLLLVLLSSACSVPSLETAECDQARDSVREFYSLHFGNGLAFGPEDMEKRKQFLTERFSAELRSTPPSTDPFTVTADQPKAFRAGECRLIEPGKRTSFDVLLFWKDDVRSEQRSITVEAENVGGRWLVDKVSQTR